MNNDYKRDVRAKKPVQKLFLILFSFGFFMILGVIFISYSFNTTHISQRDLYRGEHFNLNDNDSLTFRFEKQGHIANITLFGYNSIDITIHSSPLTKHIKVNETAFFDLDNDSKSDLRVWLVEIVNYNAVVEFKRIDGSYCTPNWVCDKWGDCVDGLRRRTCEDVERCDKTEGLPELEKFCSSVLEVKNESNQEEQTQEEQGNLNESNEINHSSPEIVEGGALTCLENNGNSCSDLQKCQGNWLNASDSLRCCSGDCYFPDILENSIICDKGISSFRLAVYNCTPFIMNCVENVLVSELGIIQRFESVFKIQGYYPGNNCLFEYGYGDVFMNYTSEKYNEFFEEGKTIGQIDFQIEILREDFTNKFKDKSMACKYPQDEFLSFARNWEEGRSEWSREILGKYECSGDLVGL